MKLFASPQDEANSVHSRDRLGVGAKGSVIRPHGLVRAVEHLGEAACSDSQNSDNGKIFQRRGQKASYQFASRRPRSGPGFVARAPRQRSEWGAPPGVAAEAGAEHEGRHAAASASWSAMDDGSPW